MKVERRAADFIGPHETIRPLRDRILVKVLPLKLSAIIEAEWTGKAVRGEIIAVGPGTYPIIHSQGWRDGKEWRDMRESKRFRKTEVTPGLIVQLDGKRYADSIRSFPKVYIGHEEHILIQEDDIAGIECHD